MRPEEGQGEGCVLALRFAHLFWGLCHSHQPNFQLCLKGCPLREQTEAQKKVSGGLRYSLLPRQPLPMSRTTGLSCRGQREVCGT